MKKNNILLFVAGGIILVGIVFLIISYFNQEKKFVWYDRLKHEDTQPYDLVLFHEILKSNFKVDTYNKEKFKAAFNSNADFSGKGYLFIGEYAHHDVETAKLLRNFTRNGGTVFMISNFIPDSLFAELSKEKNLQKLSEYSPNYASEMYTASSVNCVLNHPEFRKKNYSFLFKSSAFDSAAYNWGMIPDYILDSRQNIVGSYKVSEGADHTNFVRFYVGKGKVYWHRNPIIFSNYYLSARNKNDSGFEYLNDILSIVNVKDWIWDRAEYNSAGKEMPRRKFSKPKTPMEFIFSHQALTWAWLMTLVMAGLYLLFGAKRKQNPIAVIEANRNTSLEFINTIGLLYYQQQNHKVIFEKIMQLFRSHLRRRYGIILKEEDTMNEEMLKQIVLKTDVDSNILHSIFEEYVNLKSKLIISDSELSSETLNKFHLLIDKFYKAEKNRKKSKHSLNH